MPATYQLIASNILSTATSTITFSSIPATYTDLVVRFSARNTASSDYTVPIVRLNNLATSIYSWSLASNNNGSSFAYTQANNSSLGAESYVPSVNVTANTFGSYEIYIPSYTSSTNKPSSAFAVVENNSTTVFDLQTRAQLFSSTGAINRVDISTPSSNFVAGSSFFLYGIKNS